MTRWERLRELVWPILEPHTAAFMQAEKARLTRDKASITKLDLTKASSTALDEARRFADAEEDRRRVADQKATTYLAVVAALVPLVVTLATAVWDKKAGSAPTWLNMLALGIAVAFASKAGLWAFRVLEVSASHRIGVTDFAKAWKETAPDHELARNILRCGRMNQAGVNAKVSGIKMAHAFLLRAFLTFAGLLMFNIAWFIFAAIWTGFSRPADPWLKSTEAALAVGLEVAGLERMLSAEPAWTALSRRCAAQGEPFTITLQSDVQVAAPDTLQRGLQMLAGDQLRLRKLQLRCGQARWAELRLWGVEARLSRPTGGDPLGVGPTAVTRLGVRRLWPGGDQKAAPMLPVLLRQTARFKEVGGVSIAYGEANILAAALGAQRRER